MHLLYPEVHSLRLLCTVLLWLAPLRHSAKLRSVIMGDMSFGGLPGGRTMGTLASSPLTGPGGPGAIGSDNDQDSKATGQFSGNNMQQIMQEFMQMMMQMMQMMQAQQAQQSSGDNASDPTTPSSTPGQGQGHGQSGVGKLGQDMMKAGHDMMAVQQDMAMGGMQGGQGIAAGA